MFALWQILQCDAARFEPFGPRLCGSEFGLDLVVLDDATLLRVDDEHLARSKTALTHHTTRLDVEHTDLTREHHEPLIGHEVAAGTETVAVEGGSHEGAVGEDEGGRAVPRLHEHGVVFVEGATIRIDIGLVLVCLRHHHHHCVRQ